METINSKVGSRRGTNLEFDKTLPLMKKTAERSTGTDFFMKDDDVQLKKSFVVRNKKKNGISPMSHLKGDQQSRNSMQRLESSSITFTSKKNSLPANMQQL